METTNSQLDDAAMPSDLRGLQSVVQGRDDDTMYEGIRAQGVDVVLAHVASILPGAGAPGGADGAQGAVQFVLDTPDGERRLWIARDGAAVAAGLGEAAAARATAAMTLANFLRLLTAEPGKDAAAQTALRSLRVTGDEALVRALPGWFLPPA
jgi:hypothetical protein